MTTPDVFLNAPRKENVLRGALLSLVIIPVGGAAWLIIWNLGFIASFVALGIAVGALFLYRLGSGGTVGKLGALVITVVTFVTILLSFLAGIVVDYAVEVGKILNVSALEGFQHPMFWQAFSEDFPAIFQANLGNFGMTLLFGALGSFGVIASAFRGQAHAGAVTESSAPATGSYTPPPASPATDDAAPAVEEEKPTA